jgi:hypothetical protein
MVLKLDRRDCCRRLSLMNVVSKISKLMLNLPKMIMNTLIVMLSVILDPCRYWRRRLMSSVMTTLGLSDGGLSDGMAIKLERMDRILP